MNDFRHKAARSPVTAHRSHFIGLNITKDRPPCTSEDVYRPFVPNRCSKWNFNGAGLQHELSALLGFSSGELILMCKMQTSLITQLCQLGRKREIDRKRLTGNITRFINNADEWNSNTIITFLLNCIVWYVWLCGFGILMADCMFAPSRSKSKGCNTNFWQYRQF